MVSAQMLELTRRGYRAWNQGDMEWFLDHMAEEVEVHPPGDMFLDLEESYVGHDGWVEFSKVWRDAWSSIEVEVERVEELGDDELAVFLRWDGVGRESGVSVSMRVAHLLRFRDGKLLRLLTASPEEAERQLAERT